MYRAREINTCEFWESWRCALRPFGSRSRQSLRPSDCSDATSTYNLGGNVTGVSLIAPELEIKRLSLLHDALPSVHRIAVLSNHRNVVEPAMLPLRNAAAERGLELVEIWVESPNEYAAAFDVMRGAGVEALVLVPTPETNRDTKQLGALAVKAGLPTIGGFRESAQGGLLIGSGPASENLANKLLAM
jgi:putative tryptophan/tyrosine transport system substrate-binding protein